MKIKRKTVLAVCARSDARLSEMNGIDFRGTKHKPTTGKRIITNDITMH